MDRNKHILIFCWQTCQTICLLLTLSTKIKKFLILNILFVNFWRNLNFAFQQISQTCWEYFCYCMGIYFKKGQGKGFIAEWQKGILCLLVSIFGTKFLLIDYREKNKVRVAGSSPTKSWCTLNGLHLQFA